MITTTRDFVEGRYIVPNSERSLIICICGDANPRRIGQAFFEAAAKAGFEVETYKPNSSGRKTPSNDIAVVNVRVEHADDNGLVLSGTGVALEKGVHREHERERDQWWREGKWRNRGERER